MMDIMDFSTKLRVERSSHSSGILLNEREIAIIKEKHYFVKNIPLDGDAPKQFIQVYIFEEDSGVLKNKPHTWHSYIAKTAEKWYPHESVIEFMINRIGQILKLNINQVQLLRINGQVRFLSKYFLKKNETLIHGAEICGEYLDDHALANEIANDKRTSRQLFTFEFTSNAIRSVFPNACEQLIINLVKMIAFDALVGNNDRHFYNWAIISTKRKTTVPPRFSPIYDSARGLLWNESDNNIKKMKQLLNHDGKKVLNYVKNAYPRISIEGDDGINHFGLVRFLKNLKKEYKVIIEELATVENEEAVLRMLHNEFYRYFINERSELISFIVSNRFKQVREI